MKTMTGVEMTEYARQEILQEQQDNHISDIKNQLRRIATATRVITVAHNQLLEEQKALTELENKDITEIL